MEQLEEETLEALSCEIGRRPEDAPTFGDVIGRVKSVRRQDDSLIVQFDPAAADVVAAYAEAERQCCSTINWQLETGPAVWLRISGTPMQIAALQEMFGIT
jgi:hypothetical protein